MDTTVAIAGLAVLLALAATAVVVPIIDEVRLARGHQLDPRRRIRSSLYWAVALAALALLLGGLAIPVFLVAVAANIFFGEDENVPFSRYPMFGRPSPMTWFIRLERLDGETIRPLRLYGLPSSSVRKRFAAELTTVTGRSGGSMNSTDDQYDQAGAQLIRFLHEAEKPDANPVPIRVVRVTYQAGLDGLIVDERVLAEEP